jgi:uncharacterized protein (TIGR04222 family)
VGILDLGGPEFLAAYVPILIGALIVGAFVRRLASPRLDSGKPMPALSSIEAAYLAGGPRQALAALVTSVAQRKLITFDEKTRSVSLVAGAGPPEDPFERQLVGLIGQRSPTLTNIESRADELFGQLRDRLKNLGLLVPDERHRIPQVLIVAVVGGALALGAAKLVVGLSRGRPVGILLILLVGGVVAMVKLLSDLPERSALGDEVLKRLRHSSAGLELSTSRSPDRLAPNDLALAVALYGPELITVGSIAVLAQSLRPKPRVAESGFFSDVSSSSCGSSCGGCGGGGCGGCSS